MVRIVKIVVVEKNAIIAARGIETTIRSIGTLQAFAIADQAKRERSAMRGYCRMGGARGRHDTHLDVRVVLTANRIERSLQHGTAHASNQHAD